MTPSGRATAKNLNVSNPFSIKFSGFLKFLKKVLWITRCASSNVTQTMCPHYLKHVLAKLGFPNYRCRCCFCAIWCCTGALYSRIHVSLIIITNINEVTSSFCSPTQTLNSNIISSTISSPGHYNNFLILTFGS